MDRDELLDLERSARLRWLEADGRGGWSSSSVLGAPMSRWDGLLTVAEPASTRRTLLLSRFEETLVFGDRSFPLSVARYPGTLHPEGWRYLWSFDTAPLPRWTYRIGHVEVTREVLRLRARDAVALRWTVTGNEAPVALRLRPFLPFRDADALTFENAALDTQVAIVAGGVAFRPYAALPRLVLAVGASAWSFVPSPQWFRRLELAEDLRRGEAGHEDAWSPGEIVAPLADGQSVVLVASADARADAPVTDAVAVWTSERRSRRAPKPGLRAALERSAEAFLFEQGGRTGVVAGYPWFREWGRDTFISLPGLLLARGRVAECGDALVGALPWLRDGRLPNRFIASPAASDYKAIDVSFWFAAAVERWAAAGGAAKRLRQDLLPALEAIADAHAAAAGDEILLRAGSAEVATTWMDAVVEGRAVTPRNGFTVEVNALWYALLDFLAERTADPKAARRRREQARRVGEAFLDRLWLADEDRLADQHLGGAPDRSVRPNMVIAASLARSPLTREQRRSVVECARRELLTPRGLRTLSPKDPAYRGRFEGRIVDCDRAYHQGTVWPWLAGAFVEASLLADGRGAANVRRLREWLLGFEPSLGERALGHVAEVHDGDPPHRPGGTWAQAWSTAELLRACVLLGIA